MNLKTKLVLSAIVLGCAGALAGCGGDGISEPNPPPPPPPPPPASASFTAFVHQVLPQPGTAATATINGVDFSFPDLNNPKAYCDVLPPSTTGPCAGGG